MTFIFEILFLESFTIHFVPSIMGQKGDIFTDSEGQWKVSYLQLHKSNVSMFYIELYPLSIWKQMWIYHLSVVRWVLAFKNHPNFVPLIAFSVLQLLFFCIVCGYVLFPILLSNLYEVRVHMLSLRRVLCIHCNCSRV